MEITYVLWVRSLGLCLQLGFATGVIRRFTLWGKKNPRCLLSCFPDDSSSALSVKGSSTGPTLLCDAVHHRAKHQDVCAAVCAASQPTVTAETCRTRKETTTLCHHLVLMPRVLKYTGISKGSVNGVYGGFLTSGSRSCVKVGEESVQFVWTEQGLPSELSSCCK